MKKKRLIFLIIIILLVVIFLVYQQGLIPFNKNNTGKESTKEGVNVGDKAPDFILESLYGRKISLNSLQGKKVLLNFWASWCGPCRSEMPDIERLHQNNETVEILAVNIRETKGTVLDFVMTNNYSFPVVLDKSGEIADKYLIRGIPVSYFLDEKGIIINKHTGSLNYNKMKEFLGLK